MIDLSSQLTQKEFGQLVGISQQAVSDLMKRNVIANNQSAKFWLTNYCDHLREQAAGRASKDGDLDLAAERAGLAKEQREKIAMQNAVTRRELAPVAKLEYALASVGARISAILEAIPSKVKRRSKNLTADDIDIIVSEINEARNIAASANIDMDEVDENHDTNDENSIDGDTESD